MSEWSKEDDPALSTRTHSSVVERKFSKLEVRGSKPFECKFTS
jgi:hypothetical protein